jgi:hypothetical protein
MSLCRVSFMLKVTYKYIMLNAFMLSVGVLSVIMLSVVMLNVVAPCVPSSICSFSLQFEPQTLRAVIICVSLNGQVLCLA